MIGASTAATDVHPDALPPPSRTLARRLLLTCAGPIAAIAIGILNTLALIGIAGLNPTNIDWLRRDETIYYMAWTFYRAAPAWQWPLLWSDRLGYPLGVSLSWLDPAPLMLILLRPLSPV